MTKSGRDGLIVWAGRYRVLSACISVLGLILIPLLLFPLASRDVVQFDLPEWGPAALTAVTLFVFVVAMVLAWIPRGSADNPATWVAFSLAVVGLVVAVIVSFVTLVLRTFDNSYFPWYLYAPSLAEAPPSLEEPLPFGTQLELVSLGTRDVALTIVVDDPVDITAIAREASLPEPVNGAYIAIPLTVQMIDPSGIIDEDDGVVHYPDSYWASQTRIEGGALDVEFSVPGYPTSIEGDPEAGVTYHYYDIFDVSSLDPTHGVYEWGLSSRDNAIDAMWGTPVDRVYARDDSGAGFSPDESLAFGSWLTLQSTVTDADAVRITIREPIDVTEAARDASLPPPVNGAYLACPVHAMVDRDALAFPGEQVALPEGAFRPNADPLPIGHRSRPVRQFPGYPGLADLTGLGTDDSFAYHEIFDVPAESVREGRCVLSMSTPSGAAQSAHWGPPQTAATQ